MSVISHALLGALAPPQPLSSDPSITDWIEGGAAALTFGVALWALIYARGQVKEARQARQQAADLEQERAQPYVVLIMEPSEATPVFLNIAIRNLGLTGAFNVRVRELTPWPQTSADGTTTERIVLPDVIPVLAPGQEFVQFWDNSRTRLESTLPDRHEGVVTWEDSVGRSFESKVILDWAVYKARHWIVVYGMHDAAKALREMQKDMLQWREGIHGGLQVYVRDGDAKDQRRREQHQQHLEAVKERESAAQRSAEPEVSSPSEPKRKPQAPPSEVS